MLDRLRSGIFKERIGKNIVLVGGLEPHKEDSRDFDYGDLGGIFFAYYPKNIIHEVKTVAVKNQMSSNTCVFQSLAACREVQEGVELSPKSVVRYAVSRGMIRGNGFSTLREGQKAGVDFGIAEAKILDPSVTTWRDYGFGELPLTVKLNAGEHKGKSYFSVKGRDATLKALDDGYAVHTGFTWRTAYNMSGGLRAPWVLRMGAGYAVGGHAVALIGYDTGRGLYKFQNSFGEDYGERGCFYIKMEDWHRMGMAGYATVDLENVSLEDFYKRYEGKDIKTNDDPTIYRVKDGTLRAYPDALTFFVHEGSFEPRSYEVVASKLLEIIPKGEPMKPEESKHWPKVQSDWAKLRWMDANESYKYVHTIIEFNR